MKCVAHLGGLVATAATIGCTAYPTFKNVPLDCDADTRYQLHVPAAALNFDMVGASVGWTAADGTMGAVMTGAVENIPDGPRCGSAAALVIRAQRNNDWGSLFGLNGFAYDGAAYDGLAFWARAGYNSNTGFTILLDDPNTNNPNMPAACDVDAGAPPAPVDAGSVCKNYCNDGGSGSGTTDQGTGMIIPGTVSAAPEPDQCGNSYQTPIAVSSYWKLYKIPFSEFRQTATPNRVPNATLTETGAIPGTGIRPKSLLNLIFRLPKAMPTELWIDNLGFYREAAATGGDGGVSAP